MKKVLFSVLMISAMFVLASCGSKSNSNEAAAEATTEEEEAKVEAADPPFTYATTDTDRYENVPLKGCFEIQKVGIAKSTDVSSSSRLSAKIIVTINLKMIKDFPQKVDDIRCKIQLLDKNGTILDSTGKYKFDNELSGLTVGDIGVISSYCGYEYDSAANEVAANTKYIRIAEFEAGHKSESGE